METRRNRPLDGVTVIDFGQVYQGPYATYLMAMAGATVIKIEPLGGEPVRQRRVISPVAAAPFAMLNGHKKCIALDIKSEAGKEIVRGLVKNADVLLENFAPGVMDKLGIGYEALRQINPRLVYASGSGYGLSGPDRDNLAMDVTVQAASGLMSVTGFPDGPPVKAGPALVDFLSGIHLYAGVMTVLYERQFTGVGRLVEVSMQETVFPAFASNLSFLYENNQVPPRTGNRHGGLATAPYNVYPTRDGYISIIAIKEGHWNKLLDAMGRQDLLTNPDFNSKAARVRNLEQTDQLITDWSSKLGRDEAMEILRKHKVPSAPVRDLVEVANDPHMHERGILEWIDHPEFGRVVVSNNPIIFHGAERARAVPSADLGAHTGEVLAGMLGMSEDEIEALDKQGVIGRA
ncbi:CoA transferase [Rhodovarius crocodyli]|uniref:CoA transferase n=1 Tax=Rhodovarius crocodyli TaxID=1979269 RepID=A0A437M2J7_9PROT|nr:CoA transferase [Rhodovarius crocodyli]RVT91724.1 CoA transferase [Rhodovarius crocodyli]